MSATVKADVIQARQATHHRALPGDRLVLAIAEFGSNRTIIVRSGKTLRVRGPAFLRTSRYALAIINDF